MKIVSDLAKDQIKKGLIHANPIQSMVYSEPKVMSRTERTGRQEFMTTSAKKSFGSNQKSDIKQRLNEIASGKKNERNLDNRSYSQKSLESLRVLSRTDSA